MFLGRVRMERQALRLQVGVVLLANWAEVEVEVEAEIQCHLWLWNSSKA